jgi:hypothetical protein
MSVLPRLPKSDRPAGVSEALKANIVGLREMARIAANGIEQAMAALGVGERLTPLQFHMLCRVREQLIDRTCAAIIEKAKPQHGAPGCVQGCSHCCYQFVIVSASEAFRIANRARTDYLPREAIRASANHVAGLTHTERFKRQIPCAMLMGDLCSVYRERPSICRGYFSYSRLKCQIGFITKADDAKVPLAAEPMHASELMRMSSDLVLRKMGLQMCLQEIGAGVAAAMEDGLLERWLAGEAVFSRPEGDEYDLALDVLATELIGRPDLRKKDSRG